MNSQVLLPKVSEAEIAALKQEISARGAMQPIQACHGEIVGVSCLITCLHLDILPTFQFLHQHDAAPSQQEQDDDKRKQPPPEQLFPKP